MRSWIFVAYFPIFQSLIFLPSLAQIPPIEFSTLSHSNWLCQWLLTEYTHISFQPFGFSMKKAPLNDLKEKEVHFKTIYGLYWELDLVRGSSLHHYVWDHEVSAFLCTPSWQASLGSSQLPILHDDILHLCHLGPQLWFPSCSFIDTHYLKWQMSCVHYLV